MLNSKEKLAETAATIDNKTEKRLTVDRFEAKMKKRKTKWLYMVRETHNFSFMSVRTK